MKFTKDADVEMTSLQGHVSAKYDQLVAVFGEPTDSGDKTTAEWALQFEDGTVATIYDWKEYTTPMGMYRWHIGGHSMDAVARVIEAVTKQGVY
jgi:hypothetical protein